MIVHELDLATARAPVRHATAGRDARDELLVQRAADGCARELPHQAHRRVEDAARRAADILAEDKKARVALDDLDQPIVDRLDHRRLARRPTHLLRLVGRDLDHALGDPLGGHLRLAEHLLLGAVDLGPHLVVDALDVLLGEQPAVQQNLAHALHGILGACRLLDLFARAIAADVGAARMGIEQANMQMHESRTFAGAQPRDQLARRLVGRDGVHAVHIHRDGVHRSHLRREVAGPLRLAFRHNGPVVVGDDHQHGEFVDRGLAQQDVKVIGGGAAVAGDEGDDAPAAVALKSPANAAREGRQSADLAEGGQHVVPAAAIV